MEIIVNPLWFTCSLWLQILFCRVLPVDWIQVFTCVWYLSDCFLSTCVEFILRTKRCLMDAGWKMSLWKPPILSDTQWWISLTHCVPLVLPPSGHCLFLELMFYSNTDILILQWPSSRVEQLWQSPYVASKTWNIYYLALSKESLPTPALLQ